MSSLLHDKGSFYNAMDNSGHRFWINNVFYHHGVQILCSFVQWKMYICVLKLCLSILGIVAATVFPKWE